MTIGFVTCELVGGITPDDELVVAALAGYGVPVLPLFWDAREPFAEIRACIVRSPWDYHLNPQEFLAWVDRAGGTTPTFNPPRIIRWNAHKGYLLELHRAGVPIIETALCAMHAPADLRAIMRERGWERAIVKPAISASSYMTAAIDLADVAAGQRLMDDILQTRDALVQPFMSQVHDRGERCLIFIDGAFSHAVQKTPFTGVSGSGAAAQAQPQEIEAAERALAALPEMPLYARVDLLRDAEGVDRLMELELIDPELYFRFDLGAANRFAAAIMRRL